jgi:hypothetical protein
VVYILLAVPRFISSIAIRKELITDSTEESGSLFQVLIKNKHGRGNYWVTA